MSSAPLASVHLIKAAEEAIRLRDAWAADMNAASRLRMSGYSDGEANASEQEFRREWEFNNPYLTRVIAHGMHLKRTNLNRSKA